MKRKKLKSPKEAAIMFFVGILMFAGSLVIGYLLGKGTLDQLAMQEWQQTQATITKARLKSSTSGTGNRRSTTYKSTARYTYHFAGQQYEGTRVNVLPTADNFTSYHRDMARLLKKHEQSKEPLPCWFNPEAPQESILVREMAPYQIGVLCGFFLVFFTLGFGGTWAACNYLLEQLVGEKSLLVKISEVLSQILINSGWFGAVAPICLFIPQAIEKGASSSNWLWFIFPAGVVLTTLAALAGVGQKKKS